MDDSAADIYADVDGKIGMGAAGCSLANRDISNNNLSFIYMLALSASVILLSHKKTLFS